MAKGIGRCQRDRFRSRGGVITIPIETQAIVTRPVGRDRAGVAQTAGIPAKRDAGGIARLSAEFDGLPRLRKARVEIGVLHGAWKERGSLIPIEDIERKIGEFPKNLRRRTERIGVNPGVDRRRGGDGWGRRIRRMEIEARRSRRRGRGGGRNLGRTRRRYQEISGCRDRRGGGRVGVRGVGLSRTGELQGRDICR